MQELSQPSHDQGLVESINDLIHSIHEPVKDESLVPLNITKARYHLAMAKMHLHSFVQEAEPIDEDAKANVSEMESMAEEIDAVIKAHDSAMTDIDWEVCHLMEEEPR